MPLVPRLRTWTEILFFKTKMSEMLSQVHHTRESTANNSDKFNPKCYQYDLFALWGGFGAHCEDRMNVSKKIYRDQLQRFLEEYNMAASGNNERNFPEPRKYNKRVFLGHQTSGLFKVNTFTL